MPVIADKISLNEVNMKTMYIFTENGSAPKTTYSYWLNAWGVHGRHIHIESEDNLGLDMTKHYRISIEETDGR